MNRNNPNRSYSGGDISETIYKLKTSSAYVFQGQKVLEGQGKREEETKKKGLCLCHQKTLKWY